MAINDNFTFKMLFRGELMNKIYEKIKDILYDTFDYVVMIGIIFVVVAIIGWRLDVLFANDIKDIPATEIHTAVEPEKPNENSEEEAKEDEELNAEVSTVEESETEEEPTEKPETPIVKPPVEEDPIETPATPPKPTGVLVKIEIPSGSYPGRIGAILVDAGVIDNSKDFIAKAVEQGKEGKLKAGTFSIPKGSSYEDVIAILSK